MTTVRWPRTGVLVSVLLVGLAAVVSAKKPPPPDVDPTPIRYVIEWLPENFRTEPMDVEFVYDELVVVGTDEDLDYNERAFVYTEMGGVYTEEAGMNDLTTLVKQSTGIALVPDISLDGITLISADCINDLGQVSGIYVDYDGTDLVDEGIYVWDPLAVTPTLYTRSLPDVRRVYDISDGAMPQDSDWDGTVVGTVSSPDGTRGFAWQPAAEFFEVLPIDSLYDATGINRNGDIVGRIELSHGLVIFNYALEIDGNGELIGDLTIISDTSNKGPTGYRMTTRYSWGRDRIDINDLGKVVGNVETRRYFAPALYDGAWTELTLEESGYPIGINNDNQVCGITPVKDFDLPDTGFVDHVDGYWSLNDLILGNLEDPLADPDIALWFSGDARDKCLPHGISNRDPDPNAETSYGTIVGYKWIQASGSRGFILRPQSE